MSPEPKPAPAAHIRLVLADDHPAVRAGIRQFLERDPGLEVVAEANKVGLADAPVHPWHNLRRLFTQFAEHGAVHRFRAPLTLTQQDSMVAPIDRHDIHL